MKLMGIAFISAFFCALSFADAKVGEPAPAFSVTDVKGKPQSLEQYKGKNVVVLEWYNKDCPFVRRHYDSKGMQGLQKKYTGKDVIWLTVISSGEGKEGYQKAEEFKADSETAAATGVILDPEGKLGTDYGAKTTPHMFVVDKTGTVVYAGAIDDAEKRKGKKSAKVFNFVENALDKVLGNKKVAKEDAAWPAYGCGVKYSKKS